jgi:dihydrofolate reductase
MRASVFVGTSVDGFIARSDDGLDFLEAGDGSEGAESSAAHGFEEFMATVDALVMGHNTYDVVRKFDKWYYGTKPVFVLSTRELKQPPAGAVVERISGTPAEVMQQLQARSIEHVYVDGGNTIQQFLHAGLITRMIISRVPVLIGSGISLFGALDGDIRLRHMATRTFPGGMVQTEYAVVPD